VVLLENKMLEKDLVFYVPSHSGAVFTRQAGNLINDEMINETLEILADEVEGPIQYVEERRVKPREVA
jgi:hypothetical protein